MKNWVLPSVAAELWNLPVEAILASVREGRLQSKEDAGFTFVAIDTDLSFTGRPHSAHPPTYSVITPAERAALSGATDSLEITPDEQNMIEDWRSARSRTSQSRRGPSRAEAA